MKVVWLHLGEAPDAVLLREIEATGVAFDIRDPVLDLPYLRKIRDQLLTPYVYSTPHWPETRLLDGPTFAEWTHARLNVIAPRTGNALPCVCFDIEYHDAAFVRDCLRRWRELRPTRITDWTLESFQWGWEDSSGDFHKGWASELAGDVVTYDVLVAPQFYDGDMNDMAADRAILNAVRGGCPVDRLIGCQDAASLPLIGWKGYAFTQGRLP